VETVFRLATTAEGRQQEKVFVAVINGVQQEKELVVAVF